MSLQVEIEKKLNDKVLSVSFDTEGKQGITGILGASGCGKSMTLKCIAGIETPDRGKIVLNGRVLFDSGKKINLRVQDRHVGYLFQNYALFENMTVLRNVEYALKLKKETRGTARETAMKMIEMVGLSEHVEKKPAQLSGGQMQRVAICRALMQNPGILLADEPVASLDPKNTQRIMDVLREISEQGISVMVNLHSVELVRAYCTRVIGVASGQLIFDDHPSRLTQDVLQRLYGDEVSQLH